MAISAGTIIGIGFVLTDLLRMGVTWRQILNSVDESGNLDPNMKDRILLDQKTWENEWKAKRAAERG